MSATPTVEQFFQTVRRSGLLDEAALRSFLATLPADCQSDAVRVADALVRAGKLSRYQANVLLKGMARGLIFGPYQILSQIGKGGMATVFLARDSRTQALVALKILSPRKARAEERLVARFQRETGISRRVDHPNICKAFEAGVVDDVLYQAMEFIPGKSLSKLVADGGPLAVPRLARLMAGVASGLRHVHDLGLVHRDVKPGNILVTPHDQAKLVDLGLALLEGEVVEDAQVVGGTGYVVGTMDYIAPEQTYDPTGVDARADLYSLGCTLYYAASGRPPFPGGTSKEKIYRQRRDDPDALQDLRPDLPRGFVALVRRFMVKNPVERVGSAREAEEMLLRWASDEPPPTEQELILDVNAAVAALQTKEPTVEFSWGDLEVAAPEPAPARSDAPAEERPTAAVWLVLAVVALLVVAVVVLVLTLAIR